MKWKRVDQFQAIGSKGESVIIEIWQEVIIGARAGQRPKFKLQLPDGRSIQRQFRGLFNVIETGEKITARAANEPDYLGL